jgi:hypothetical protein
MTQNLEILNALKILKRDVTKIKSNLENMELNHPSKLIYDTQEMCLLFHISPRTLTEWRNKNYIPYSKIGNKIYFKRMDVLTMIDKFYYPINPVE